jgi:hypothetical protein
MNFPVFSQLAGNSNVRDEFAPDCFLQRRVTCELTRSFSTQAYVSVETAKA